MGEPPRTRLRTLAAVVRDIAAEPLRFPLLGAALVLYAALAATTVREVGLVGEVSVAWALERPPEAWVDVPAAGAPTPATVTLGPLEVSRVRPALSLLLGDARMPLAVNAYTGGLADLPARVARALTGSVAAGRVSNGALGGLLILLGHRFLRFHASVAAAGAAALVLASDWAFGFYRAALGGTEVLLLASGLLVLWALWSRRWRGGRHGTAAVGVGVGLGLHAKLTFALPLAGLALAAWLTRGDRPAVGAPPPPRWAWLLGAPLVLLAPLLLAAWASAHAGLPVVPSHDTLALQLARVGATLSALLGDARLPAREGASNLLAFLGDPRASLHAAWGATPVPLLSGLRGVTFATSLAGAVLAWRSRGTPDPSGALLRFLSLAVPLQLAVITLVNREMHHLGQVSVGLALLVALGAERVAGAFTPPRGIARALLTLVCVAPTVVAGVRQRAGTDALLDTVRTPTFTQRGQAELGALLRAHADDCPRVVVADYESFGVLEGVAPEVRVTHVWPAVARGVDRGAILRATAERRACLLSVRSSAPMVYGWEPSGADLARVGAPVGVEAVWLGERVDAAGAWATLWRMGRVSPSPARQGPEGRP